MAQINAQNIETLKVRVEAMKRSKNQFIRRVGFLMDKKVKEIESQNVK